MNLNRGQVPLMPRMAETVGADLRRLTPPELAMAGLRCAGCARAEACRNWLGVHQTSHHTPDFCLNADTMARLQVA